MADNQLLDAQIRTVVGKKCKALRRQGLVPGIIYGPKIEPINVQFAYRPLQLALLKSGGTHLIDLSVDGKTYPVLAREVQRDVVRGNILHVDFLAVDMKAKIRATIPVQFINESPAVESRIGIQINGASSVEVEALPGDLPDRIEVDLSKLADVNDSLHVRDLDLGKNIEVVGEPEEMIVRIAPITVAQETEGEALEEEEVTSSEPELIGRGKREDEEDEEV